MQIFDSKHLLLDINVKTQKEAFQAIAQLAHKLQVTNNPDNLVKDLIKREQVSTTGMADEVAIPHAMSADFNRPAIIVARFKKGIEWKAVGGKPVKVAFALLIPEKSRGTLHMQYLQNIATALLNKKFNDVILKSTNKNLIIKTITKAIERKEEAQTAIKPSNKNVSVDKNKLIVGVSSCATGVAHTYMAREALEKHGKNVGYDVWIETQGQSGQEHKLTPELIQKADAIVIASDINVELDRFAGKKIYLTNTNEAINTPVQTLKKTINSTRIQQGDSGAASFGDAKKGSGFMNHFLNGVSHMIPFIVFSGIVYAILNAIGVGIYSNGTIPSDSTLGYALQAANIGFSLFTGVMGGYIAMSIAGRAALGPGFIATVCASTPAMYIFWKGIPSEAVLTINGEPTHIHNISLGIIAALMMGFSAGHLTNLFNKIKMHKMVKPILPLIIIPVVCTSLLVFPFQFALSGIMGCAMNYFGAALALAGTNPGGRIAIGFVMGAMVGFDMGGPINKIAVATATTLIPVDPSLMGGVAAAIPIAPLGCGLASVVFGRKLFDDNEKGLGATALALGFMGISEGAIPFAAKRLKQTFIANIIGSAISGALACMFFVGGHVGMWGGLIIIFCLGVYPAFGQAGSGLIRTEVPAPFALPGHTNPSDMANVGISCAWYIVAIAIGAITHALIYVILIRASQGGGLLNSVKATFHRDKKNTTTNVNQSKFDNWYRTNLVQDNWYYRAKVLKQPAIIW